MPFFYPFRSCFYLFALLFVLLSFVGLVVFRCPLSCFVCSCVLVGFCFFFLSVYVGKKKGREGLPLRPLLVCCVLLYLRIVAAFLSATAAALWHSWSEPKNGGMCGNSGINTMKQSFKGCFSIFANLNDFIFSFSLRLFCRLWACYMFSASLSVASFAFENIQPAPQVR